MNYPTAAFPLVEGMTPKASPMPDRVKRLREETAKLPQVELVTDHFYADKMYLRRVFRKKGTLICGKEHKKQHFYIVVTGHVQVTSDTDVKDYYAGDVIVSQPGTQRAVLALEDSVCMTVHHSAKRNLDKLEAELVEPAPDALFDARNQRKLT